MFVMIAFGTLGYVLIGGGEWPFLDCLYMTVMTITTVGYGEVLPLHLTAMGRPFSILLMLLSLGMNTYFIASLTTFFLSEEFEGIWWRRNMENLLSKMTNHIIICGGGETGIHAMMELRNSGYQVVLIDDNAERAKGLQETLGQFPLVIGDATDELTLLKAGIERAYGLAAILSSDKDNLFVTITARRMNPRLKIVSRGIEINSLDKILRAGADRVVSPNYIGGIRIATEMVRPHVVQFLDMLTHTNDLDLQLEQIDLPLYSPYVGKQLKDTDLRKKQILVLAVRSPEDATWIYNPKPDYLFEPLSTMIVLGTIEAVKALGDEIATYQKQS